MFLFYCKVQCIKSTCARIVLKQINNNDNNNNKNVQLYTFYCKLNVGFVTSVYMYMYIRG